MSSFDVTSCVVSSCGRVRAVSSCGMYSCALSSCGVLSCAMSSCGRVELCGVESWSYRVVPC